MKPATAAFNSSMRKTLAERRILLGIVALGLLAALAVPVGLTIVRLLRAEVTVAYPGATLTSEHRLEQWLPSFWLRRDSAYRTSASFLDVHRYYSVDIGLGPEQSATSGCVVMARSDLTAHLLAEAMPVTLCDTPDGRLIYVMRSIAVRLR